VEDWGQERIGIVPRFHDNEMTVSNTVDNCGVRSPSGDAKAVLEASAHVAAAGLSVDASLVNATRAAILRCLSATRT